jgi:hypothetical protein
MTYPNTNQSSRSQKLSGVSRFLAFLLRRTIVKDVVQGIIIGAVLAFITAQILMHTYVTTVTVRTWARLIAMRRDWQKPAPLPRHSSGIALPVWVQKPMRWQLALSESDFFRSLRVANRTGQQTRMQLFGRPIRKKRAAPRRPAAKTANIQAGGKARRRSTLEKSHGGQGHQPRHPRRWR